MVYQNETVQGGTMTWEILDSSEFSFEESYQIIENALIFYAEEGISSDKNAQKDLNKAWQKLQELAQKGLVADKYYRIWRNEHEK